MYLVRPIVSATTTPSVPGDSSAPLMSLLTVTNPFDSMVRLLALPRCGASPKVLEKARWSENEWHTS
jgi:hypothetical protein